MIPILPRGPALITQFAQTPLRLMTRMPVTHTPSTQLMLCPMQHLPRTCDCTYHLVLYLANIEGYSEFVWLYHNIHLDSNSRPRKPTDCVHLPSQNNIYSLRTQVIPLRVKMEPPPSMFVSFSDTRETRVCGRETCQRVYNSCTQEEKAKWKRVTNTRNTEGDTNRWICGTCTAYYDRKTTTHRRGANAKLPFELITDFPVSRRYNFCSQQ